MKHKYLTEIERYQIESCLKVNMKVSQIAELMHICRATVYNEIKRGTIELIDYNLKPYTKYCADVGQRVANSNKLKKGCQPIAINDNDYLEFLKRMILKEKYSPYAIVQFVKNNDLNYATVLSERSIYNYVYKGYLQVKKTDLLQPRKKQKKEKIVKRILKNQIGTSIENRPEHISNRDCFGHWEMDTVYTSHNADTHECLLVLTERKTRIEELYKMSSKTSAETVRILNDIENRIGLEEFKNRYLSITSDNGREFLDYNGITTSLSGTTRTRHYYCHPYSSFERGSNENQNRLVRRFIPKGADISKYSDDYINDIEYYMNNYPRRIFNGLSAYDMSALE